jgi:carbon-monoxide dehydrogenase medium subunit
VKPAKFALHTAESADEAVALLSRYDGEAKVIAGGQSLLPMMNLRLAMPAALVDVEPIPGLGAISLSDRLHIGATARQSVALRSPEVLRASPLIAEALSYVSHPAIRNRGTVGGSLVHADPAAELPAVMLALDAEFTVRGPAGIRSVPASEFFATYFTTDLAEDELLTEVAVPSWADRPRARSAFMELTRRHGDFAIVGVAAALDLAEDGTVTEARIALCGVADVPVRAYDAEAVLVGGRLDDEALVREAGDAAAAPLDPGSDVHASGEYRRDVAAVLVRRSINLCASRAREGG